MSKNANHYLSLQRVITFLLVEGLKYFGHYQSVTAGHKASRMAGKWCQQSCLSQGRHRPSLCHKHNAYKA